MKDEYTMKHLTEEDLILLYYSEPEAPADAGAHLAECGVCREAADSLARTLAVCDDWTVPERDPEFGRTVWAQIAPQLDELPRLAWWRQRSGLRWAWLMPAFAALLLLGAFLAGRATKKPEPVVMAGLSDTARQRILAISLADHLDRAEMLMTEISNVADLGAVRGRAHDMVDEGRLMRQSLALQGETATLSLLDEVERFLIEVSNAPERPSPAEIRSLRERIDSGSLLFKVRIIESNLRTEGQKS